MTSELLRGSYENDIRSWKELLLNMNLLKLKSPEGIAIVPELIADLNGHLIDATFADYLALLNMCIYGYVAEYPDFQSLGITPDYARYCMRRGYNRRDYEPTTEIINVKNDCDNDTLLIKTKSFGKIIKRNIPLSSERTTEEELKRLQFGLQSPGVENGLIMSVVLSEDWKPLMVGVKNRAALAKTIETGLATFQTRSRGGKLWTKGEESGNYIEVKGLKVLGGNILAVIGSPKGPVCHTGGRTCFE